MHGVDDLLDLGRAEARHRRVAAHAAGVRSLVAVEDPLVVLRRRQRHDVLAVAERQQRELFAREELLQHDGRLAEAPLAEEDLDRVARGGLRVADDHALAGRQAVGLEDQRDRRHRRGARAPPRGWSGRRRRRSARRPPPSAAWRTPSTPPARRRQRSARRRRPRRPPEHRPRPRPAAPPARPTTRSTRALARRGDDRLDVSRADVRQALRVGGYPGVAGRTEQLGRARTSARTPAPLRARDRLPLRPGLSSA